jgi:hypothetical protein
LYSFFETGRAIAGWRGTQYDGIVASGFARPEALGFRLMMIVMLIAGIGGVLAGIVAILLGLPVKEFSFGNTLILAGVVGVCTGAIVLALAVVVGELRLIARRLGNGTPAETRQRPALATAPGAPRAYPDAGEDGFLFSRDQAADDEAGQIEPTAPGALPPWRDEAASRGRQDAPFEPDGAESAPATKPRRNLMFSSSSRKERERAQGRLADPPSPEFRPAPPVVPPVPEADEAPPATFDDAWPKPERMLERSRAELPAPRRARAAPATLAETSPLASAADRQAPLARNLDEPSVTVLKSGVVDGMAYSLYSDGSIEAEMPEGMMRFASIDELRAHLDQRL